MSALINTLIATLLISFTALAGMFTITMQPQAFKRLLGYLVAFSAGVIIAVVFSDLVPEVLEDLPHAGPAFIIAGAVLFLFLESILEWHHHSRMQGSAKRATKQSGSLFLLGDYLHNFVDGTIIAAAFITNFGLGVTATIAVGLHEIPKGLSDFGIYLNSGLSTKKALLYNYLAATAAILGGLLFFAFETTLKIITPIFLGVAAGGFTYIAFFDLLHELTHEKDIDTSIKNITLVVLGVLAFYFVGALSP